MLWIGLVVIAGLVGIVGSWWVSLATLLVGGMALAYPAGITNFPTRNTGDVITKDFFNVPNTEITAIETGLLNGIMHPLRLFSFGGEIDWGNNSSDLKLYHGSAGTDGALTIQATLNSVRTGLQLVPTTGTLPVAPNALVDFVLYNSNDQSVNFNRFNLSAMPDLTYRFGQETFGTSTVRDINFATESGGSSPVVAGQEVYLKIAGTRVGSSQPIALQYAHLRFDVDSVGGLGTADYIGRGGTGNLTYNVPVGSQHVFLVNNVAYFQVTTNQVTLPAIVQTTNLVSLGGGSVATLGTVGGAGPVTSAQNGWLRLQDAGGNPYWVPAWK